MSSTHYADLFNADVSEVDPETDLIIGFEEERQARRFVLIPSESIAPLAVRQALGSVFNNIYAEGYPPLRMTRDEEDLVLDYAQQLAYYRRYSDRRFYKGVEYADVIEALAQRRVAQCFATEDVPADHMGYLGCLLQHSTQGEVGHVGAEQAPGAAVRMVWYGLLKDRHVRDHQDLPDRGVLLQAL